MTLDNRLHPCPICGAKAFVRHDIVDGFEFGWSVGCPRACIKDGIHGFDDYETFKKQGSRCSICPLKKRQSRSGTSGARKKERASDDRP